MEESKAPFVKRGYGHIRGKKNPDHKTITFTNEHVHAFMAHLESLRSNSEPSKESEKDASSYVPVTQVSVNKPKPKPTPAPQTVIPSSYNLLNVISIPESQVPYDQGSLGSCTANATAFAYVFDELKQNNVAK